MDICILSLPSTLFYYLMYLMLCFLHALNLRCNIVMQDIFKISKTTAIVFRYNPSLIIDKLHLFCKSIRFIHPFATFRSQTCNMDYLLSLTLFFLCQCDTFSWNTSNDKRQFLYLYTSTMTESFNSAMYNQKIIHSQKNK